MGTSRSHKMLHFAALLLLASIIAVGAHAPPHVMLTPHDAALLSASGRAVRPPSPPGPTLSVSVIALGGDPTGVADSSDAFDAAVAAAAALQNRSAAGAQFWALGSHRVTIDLGGGVFTISRPLLLHGPNSSQTTLSGGALQAAASFSPGGFMVDIGGWALGVTLSDLVLDAAGRCGGIRINGAEQTTVDRTFVVHYATVGLFGDNAAGQSNELLVSSSYFAEKQWGEQGFNVTAQQNGTGIHMKFCDSHFTSIIVRCTLVGVLDEGGANVYQNAHIYSTCNKAGSENVAVGMIVAAEGLRIAGCNFDDSPVLVHAFADLLLSGSVFYGLSGLIFAPLEPGIKWARGLLVTGNAFVSTPYAPNPTIHYDTRGGWLDVSMLNGIVVADNAFGEGAAPRATRATMVVPVAAPAGGAPPCAGFSTSVNFSDTLIFCPPPAPAVRHAPAVAAALANAAARARGGAQHERGAAPVETNENAGLLFPPGISSITGAFTLTSAALGEFGVFNAGPSAEFGVLNVTAGSISSMPQATCGAILGALSLTVDQAAPVVGAAAQIKRRLF